MWAKERRLVNPEQPLEEGDQTGSRWVLDPLTASGVCLAKGWSYPPIEIDGLPIFIDEELLAGPPPHGSAMEALRSEVSISKDPNSSKRLITVSLDEQFLATANVADIVKEATRQLGQGIIESAKDLGRTT